MTSTVGSHPSTVVNHPSTFVNHPSKMAAEAGLLNVEEVDSRSNNDHKPNQFRIDDQSDRVSTHRMSNGERVLNGKNSMSNGDQIQTNQIPVTNGDRVSTSQHEKRVSNNSTLNGENRQKLSTTNGDVDEIQPLTNGDHSKSVESRFATKVSRLLSFYAKIIF